MPREDELEMMIRGARLSDVAAKPAEVRFLGDLQRLEIGPNDRFVLNVDGPVNAEVHARIQEAWRGFAGDGVALLVLDQAYRLGAINVGVTRVPNCEDPDNREADITVD